MAGNLRALVAELVGAFALVFAGAGAVCMDALTGGQLGWTGVALAQGLAAAWTAAAFSSGASPQFNPALTAALYANGRLPLARAIVCIAAQLLGAALAGLLLRAALHARPELAADWPYLGSCDLTAVGYKAATLLEAVGSFFVVWAAYGSAAGEAPSSPLALGAAYAFSVLAIGPLTGAALNPARAFGPALASGHWSHWWVYWVGPAAGAASASLLHDFLRSRHAPAPRGARAPVA